MPSKISIFCGKGGVGKTTISLAMALKHAAAGKRTLVVTSHPLPELATAVSLEGLGAQYPAAVRNLFIVHLDAQQLLTDEVERRFPVSASAEQDVRDAIFRNLVEVAPGLKPLCFLARLQQLAERKAEGSSDTPQYEFLIWDAPPIAYFLSTLRAARAFEHRASGPLAEAGATAARFFSNAANITVAPVATFEEMAIEETVEMAAALARDFRLRGTRVVLNMASPVVFDRGRMERQRAELLESRLGIPALAIPRLIHGGSDLAMLGQLAGFLELPAAA